MVFDQIERDGIVYYQAATDGFRCVFSTRIGGVSQGVCESLNLGWTNKDKTENVAQNRAIFSEVAGFENPKLLRQVHGARVIDVSSEEEPDIQEADALVTSAAGRALGILTADCVPVVLWDQRAGCAGAAHAGRLGTIRGVAVVALKKMADLYGSKPSDVQALIGPGIGPEAYEVGEDALDEVRSNIPDWRSFIAPLGGKKALLDLWGMNRSALERAGVPSNQIFTLDLCTKGNPKEFFSYRRDGPGVGRMMSVVWRL